MPQLRNLETFTKFRGGLLLIFSGCLLFLCSCEPKNESKQTSKAPVPVIASTPTIKDVTLYLESIGILRPAFFLELKPQVSGLLLEVLVHEGQWVDQGTSLFLIDPRQHKIKVQEAEAQLARDEAGLQAIKKKLNRYKELAQKDLIAQVEWDDLEAEVKKLEALTDLDRAHISLAQLDLEHCTVVAPFAGRIGKLDLHPGMFVVSGQENALTTLSQVSSLVVEFNLTEREFQKEWEEGKEFEIQTLCSQSYCGKGIIHFCDSHFDSKTGLLLVRGMIENADYALRPGQSVRIRIPVKVAHQVKLIPQKAIKYNQQGPFVYVIQPDMSVVSRQLILGQEEGLDQIVLEGIDAVERIVLEGHMRISSGIKVEIKS